MRFYPFHVGDYTSHTQHLDELEDLAYRRMLDYIYLNEINLPESVDEIARLIRMRTHCQRIATVLREFFTLKNGEWVNNRAELELGKFKEKSDKAKEAANKRWGKVDADALPTDSEGNANQDPRPNNQEKDKTLTSSDDDKTVNTIDYQAILDTYNRTLPELPSAKLLTDKRKSAIRSCVAVSHRFSEDGFWQAYFERVRESDFLMGRTKDWKADFDFLTTRSKFVKVLEGSY